MSPDVIQPLPIPCGPSREDDASGPCAGLQSRLTARSAFLVILLLEFLLLGSWLLDPAGWFSLAILAGAIFLAVRVFLTLREFNQQALLLFTLSVGSIRLTTSIRAVAFIHTFNLGWAFMPSDRLSAAIIIHAVLFLTFALVQLIRKPNFDRDVLVQTGVLALLVVKGVLDAHTFLHWSLYQYLLDASILFGCTGFLAEARHRRLAVSERDLWACLKVILCLALIDGLGSMLRLTSWARSWRQGYNGILSGSEVYLAALAGTAFLILWAGKSIKMSLRAALCAFLAWCIILTFNTTALVAVLASAILFANAVRRSVPRLRLVSMALLVSLVIVGTTFYIRKMVFTDTANSTASRVGTVIAVVPVVSEHPVLGGGSGIFETMEMTNMAQAAFDSGYGQWLGGLGLPSGITEEVISRSGSEDEGASNPHISPFFLIASYGVVILPLVIWLYGVLPYRFFKAWRRGSPLPEVCPMLYFFFWLFSIMHPRIYIFEFMFLAAMAGLLYRKPKTACGNGHQFP